MPRLCASGDLQVPLSEQSDRGGRPTGTRMRTAAGRPTKHAPRPRPLPSNPFRTRDSVLIRSHMLRKALIDFESGFRNQKNEYSRKRFRHCHFCLPSATYNRQWVGQRRVKSRCPAWILPGPDLLAKYKWEWYICVTKRSFPHRERKWVHAAPKTRSLDRSDRPGAPEPWASSVEGASRVRRGCVEGASRVRRG